MQSSLATVRFLYMVSKTSTVTASSRRWGGGGRVKVTSYKQRYRTDLEVSLN